MEANTRVAAGRAKLEEALSMVSHREPEWWIPDNGTFTKKNGTNFEPHDEEAITFEARQTGWKPGNPFDENNFRSPATHVALQQFGVGVGHPLYEDMMMRFDVDVLEGTTKAELINEYVPYLPERLARASHFRDVVCWSINHHLAQQYYERVGKVKMDASELLEKRAIADKHEAEELKEAARRLSNLKRGLPPHDPEDERAAKRVAPGGANQDNDTVDAGMLEGLVKKLRREGRGHCDLTEIVRSTWCTPNPFRHYREPSAADSESGPVDPATGSEDGASHGEFGRPSDSDQGVGGDEDVGGDPDRAADLLPRVQRLSPFSPFSALPPIGHLTR